MVITVCGEIALLHHSGMLPLLWQRFAGGGFGLLSHMVAFNILSLPSKYVLKVICIL